MYAIVSVWQLDAARYDEQQEGLRERIIPMVRSSPGFVEGYWTYNHQSAKSAGLTLFDTEEHAMEQKRVMESDGDAQRAAGVQLELALVQEIVAHVQAESGAGAALV